MNSRITGICEICQHYCGKGKYKHYRRFHPEYCFRVVRNRRTRRIKYVCQLCKFQAADYGRMVGHFEYQHDVRKLTRIGLPEKQVSWFRRKFPNLPKDAEGVLIFTAILIVALVVLSWRIFRYGVQP